MNYNNITIGIESVNQSKKNNHSYFFDTYIKPRITLAKNINLEIKNVTETDRFTVDYLFYIFDLEQIDQIEKNIENIGSARGNTYYTTIFFMVDDCSDVTLDDEDIIFNDAVIEKKITSMTELIGFMEDVQFVTFSSKHLLLIDQFEDEKTIINMSDKEINILATMLDLRTSKLEKAEKYKMVEKKIRSANLSNYMTKYGSDKIDTYIMQYFKIITQKNKVKDHYLRAFQSMMLTPSNIDEILNLYQEIMDLKLLKEGPTTILHRETNLILSKKINLFIEQYKSKVTFDSKVTNTIDPHDYSNILDRLQKISSIDNITHKLLVTELETINKQIVTYYNNQMKTITDLHKISNLIGINSKNKTVDIVALLLEILTNEKIFSDNISNTKGWNHLVDKLIELNISKQNILQIVEKIICGKIAYYSNLVGQVTKQPNRTYHWLYLQCLGVFLLSNLNKGFIYKKLHIYLSNAAKFISRGMDELINNLSEEQYYELISFETRLLELTNRQIEISSQIDLSDINIAETYAVSNDIERRRVKFATQTN